ncbi:UPF0147 family protein [archaeon]|nr:UPF0147 family protein [archaeon]
MIQDQLNNIIEMLSGIKEDNSVPKNIRAKVENTIILLNDDKCEDCIKVDKVVQELDEISQDPNLPVYTRVEVLNVIGVLGSFQ